MCGIVGYIGTKPALPILLQGLRRLEYRGYDSAGVAIFDGFRVNRVRAVGKIDQLAEVLGGRVCEGSTGIAHTRWATHGGVTKANAHPHVACTDDLVIVHNGIIENYRELKEKLGNSHRWTSETDTEVLAHLIESHYTGDLNHAVQKALSHVRGTYGLVVMHAQHPHKLVAARMGSPLVIGIGEGEHYVASDATPMLAYTKKVVFLNDGEIAEITRGGVMIMNMKHEQVEKHVEEIDWDETQAQKQGYPDFMLKEIFDQPSVFEDAIRGRIDLEQGTAHLGGINMTEDQMRAIERVLFIACGTASHAGIIAKYAFERLVGIPAEVDVASEFRYRDPVLNEKTLVFGISQSGETADTLAALREARRKGASVRGIVNVVGSTIARETDGGTYIHAGPELAVASTKAYTNMVAIMLLYAIQFARLRRMTVPTGVKLLNALKEIPRQMEHILLQNVAIKKIAEKYASYKDMLFLGRGINFAVALEGSLKLKEISYIHSEALPGGEMKHGPIALISQDFPVVCVMTRNQLYDKMRSNVEEIRARGARIILIATEGDSTARELADDVMYVPETHELLEPLLNTIPLQLFAYHIAAALGRDVDRPRNLAKSVTVE
ncbi:MAG TPA: glutamine--fructose-6-phosphate transaminase (isomerizing) [Candidatus Magasanikbacteria bacterium]|nr:glutamine--fructose-6-phosphate transaminase (isomerizing) [Candidatus Magasanikbacteria bacterium]